MIQKNIRSKKIKKDRIKINNLDDFKEALKIEGYKIHEYDNEILKEQLIKIFKVEDSTIESLYKYINNSEITYRADDTKDFIDYIRKMIKFESEHKKLSEIISPIKTIVIDRMEYERIPSVQEDIGNSINIIENIKRKSSEKMREDDEIRVELLEKEIDEHYIYTKDIELLKKMILLRNEEVKEIYNNKTKIKTISIRLPETINYEYIKPSKGTVEYHEHLSSNIPRIQRLIKSINKYIKPEKEGTAIYKIDQSTTLQDSINIAVVTYDGKEFKAISGSNDVLNYCTAPPIDKAAFESYKVNKLGKLGIGYNRVNDSEKKIFEEIHRQIEEKKLKDEGDLVLYSKWEPCPSCYLVINQFKIKHPNINVKIRYIKTYGE